MHFFNVSVLELWRWAVAAFLGLTLFVLVQGHALGQAGSLAMPEPLFDQPRSIREPYFRVGDLDARPYETSHGSSECEGGGVMIWRSIVQGATWFVLSSCTRRR